MCSSDLTTNFYIGHASIVTNFRCTYCHVAVPHGWKNKVFLVNLNDVGPEAGFTTPTERRYGTGAGSAYTAPPYYNRAALKVRQFGVSGRWDPAFCGSSGEFGNGQSGVQWMAGGNEACNNLP